MQKTVVIYHRADFDGLFCREIARKFLGEEAEYIGWDYGDVKIAWPRERRIILLDLSPDCFEGLPEHTAHLQKLIWIDHHKSAVEKFSPAIPGYRIDGVAACRLAWQWFWLHDGLRLESIPPLPGKVDFVNRRVNEPLAVRLAGEYDIWDKRDPDAETFQFGLRSVDLEPEHWAALLAMTGQELVAKLLQNGRLLQRYQQQLDADVVKHRSFTVEFEGLKFLALNTARCNSLTFAAAVQPEHDALLGFCWTGKKWTVSLYHAPGREQHDLSLIAVKHGGGGHRGACGFQCDRLPFLEPAQ